MEDEGELHSFERYCTCILKCSIIEVQCYFSSVETPWALLPCAPLFNYSCLLAAVHIHVNCMCGYPSLPPVSSLLSLSLSSPSLSLPPSPSFPHAQQWQLLCKVATKTQWYRTDTKDGVTVSRCKFGRSRQHHAVIKVDGTIPHNPDTVAQFLQLSMRPGGKLDYLFRNETLLDHIDGMPTALFDSVCVRVHLYASGLLLHC